ncbi:hypothetical protein GSMA_04167 [Serratia marcescens subsp. marcescens ATCC 13880]|nr:hypothetical protein GSMA_04167 [Serratia marcescens subsp. marcescens ATCC 13880]
MRKVKSVVLQLRNRLQQYIWQFLSAVLMPVRWIIGVNTFH